MGFVAQTPRLFTRQHVEVLNAGQIGVYGILRQGLWIYIGKGDIRQRMLDHVNGDNPWILSCQPTHWVAEVTAVDPTHREKQLIVECNPHCNQRIG